MTFSNKKTFSLSKNKIVTIDKYILIQLLTVMAISYQSPMGYPKIPPYFHLIIIFYLQNVIVMQV